MSVGSAFIKVILVVFNLAIVGIVAMSVYAVAIEDMQVDFDENDLVFEFNEDELSLYFPFSLKFGGYWDIEDFFYNYYLQDDNGEELISGGDGPIRLASGVTNNMNISASMNTSQILDRLDEDLILNGINLTLGISMGAKYFSGIFDFSLSIDVYLPLDPIFEEFGVNSSSFTYDNITDTFNFSVNHKASEFVHSISFPLAAELANQSTSLGWGANEVDFSTLSTDFTIEVNNSKLEEAIGSGDMIFLRFGLPVDDENFGPSFVINIFQLIDYNITNISNNGSVTSLGIVLNTYSTIPGSVEINATIGGFQGTDNLTLDLNSNSSGNLLFEMNHGDFATIGPDYELSMNMQLSFGPSFVIKISGSTA